MPITIHAQNAMQMLIVYSQVHQRWYIMGRGTIAPIINLGVPGARIRNDYEEKNSHR